MLTLFALLVVVLLLLLLSLVWPPDSPWAPQWRINREVARKALRLANVKKGDVVYELGCGDGEFILTAAEEFNATAVGIEIDPVRFVVSFIRARTSKSSSSIRVLRKDFKKVNLSDATVLYMYLIPAALKRLLPQLKKQLKPGTRIISYRYKIPVSSREKTILLSNTSKDNIFLYTVSKEYIEKD